MADPLVSVIIPTHTRQARAIDAARSALAQTHRRMEVWLVDDGSDPPVRIPDELQRDPRLRVIRHETARGAGEARNVAIRRAQGAFVALLDDDDVWHPEKTTRQLHVLSRAPAEIGGVHCGYTMVDEGGSAVFRHDPLAGRNLATAVLRRAVLAPSTVMLRADVMAEVGPFRTDMPRTHDWEYWVRLSDRYRVSVIGDPLVRRLAHPPIDAAVRLRNQIAMRELLAERIAALPARERERVLAHHDHMIGSYLAELGRAREARRRFRSALLRDPRRWRAIAGIVRTLVGEASWAAAKRVGALRPGVPVYRW